MLVDTEKLTGALTAQLQFVREGYNFYGEEAVNSIEFENELKDHVIRKLAALDNLEQLAQYLEKYCLNYSALNKNYLRAVKKQIPYAVKQFML